MDRQTRRRLKWIPIIYWGLENLLAQQFLKVHFFVHDVLQMAEKRPRSPPPGFMKVQEHYWEAANPRSKRRPVNGHTGIFAYHADDCLCGMAGWPCCRDGRIWSCCGETEKYCKCTKDQGKKK